MENVIQILRVLVESSYHNKLVGFQNVSECEIYWKRDAEISPKYYENDTKMLLDN